MRHLAQVLAILICTAVPAVAEPPATSPRPLARPGIVTAAPAATLSTQAALLVVRTGPVVRPRARPEGVVQEAALIVALVPPQVPPGATRIRPAPRPPGLAAAQAPAPQADAPGEEITLAAATPVPRRGMLGLFRPAPRPATRPERDAAPEIEQPGIEQVEPAAAVRIRPGREAVRSRKGSVCGDPAIKGETLAPITSRVRGCGIEDPVRVSSVDGVRLSMPATLDCTTAKALKTWVQRGLKPAFGRREVIQLQVAAHYACRPRNNVRGAPVSEHGRGKAIDISAIILEGDQSVSVLNDWRSGDGKPMVKAYRAACGPFGTTLGPNSDRFHRDHMHFDTASHRNGSYCR